MEEALAKLQYVVSMPVQRRTTSGSLLYWVHSWPGTSIAHGCQRICYYHGGVKRYDTRWLHGLCSVAQVHFRVATGPGFSILAIGRIRSFAVLVELGLLDGANWMSSAARSSRLVGDPVILVHFGPFILPVAINPHPSSSSSIPSSPSSPIPFSPLDPTRRASSL